MTGMLNDPIERRAPRERAVEMEAEPMTKDETSDRSNPPSSPTTSSPDALETTTSPPANDVSSTPSSDATSGNASGSARPKSARLRWGPRRPKPSRAVTDEDRREIARLSTEVRMGTREIAKRLGLGRRQVRAVVEALRGRPAQPAPQQGSLLDAFRAEIAEKVDLGLTVTRILREISDRGYEGGRTILADCVRTLRVHRKARRRRPKRRFETPPGKEMQADFGTYMVLIGGVPTTVHAFVCELAFSRKGSVGVFRDQRQASVFEGLEGAFHDFDGVAHDVVIDNITAIVLGRTEAEPGKLKAILHPSAVLFAEHYGFDFRPARPRHPDRKGKDENLVGFFERDCMRGVEFASWEELREAVRAWCARVNQRRHGTTGRVPDEAWSAEERDILIRLPHERFAVHRAEPRAVAPDATISIGGTLYSVPAELADSVVMVRLYAHRFEVLDPKGAVAFARGYVDPKDKGKLQLDPSHYASLRGRRREGRGRTQRLDEALRARFPGLSPLIDGITGRMKTLTHVHLALLLRLADRYGAERFAAAATKAQTAHRYDARAVERILDRDFPLVDAPTPLTTLGGGGAVLLADVDEGTLERFDALDVHEDTKGAEEPSDAA